MPVMSALPILALLSALTGAPGSAPEWSKEELRGLLGQAQAASGLPTLQAQDAALAQLAGQAYRIPAQPGEALEVYAKRVLRAREPAHPNVRKEQWLLALMRQFYEDASRRADTLARFTLERQERAALEAMAKDTAAAVAAIGPTLEVSVEGLDGHFEPLPVIEGEPPVPVGAMATVRGGVVVVENLERMRFVGDQPPADAARVNNGALRELYAALHQYNRHTQLLAPYEPQQKKNLGHLRVVIPARAPALYLNELARAARAAEMHTLHLMGMTPAGNLRELTVSLVKGSPKARPKKGKKAESASIEVRCKGEESMEVCARRISQARAQGRVVFLTE